MFLQSFLLARCVCLLYSLCTYEITTIFMRTETNPNFKNSVPGLVFVSTPPRFCYIQKRKKNQSAFTQNIESLYSMGMCIHGRLYDGRGCVRKPMYMYVQFIHSICFSRSIPLFNVYGIYWTFRFLPALRTVAFSKHSTKRTTTRVLSPLNVQIKKHFFFWVRIQKVKKSRAWQ